MIMRIINKITESVSGDSRLSNKNVLIALGLNDENNKELLTLIRERCIDTIISLDISSALALKTKCGDIKLLFLDDLLDSSALNSLKSLGFYLEDNWPSMLGLSNTVREVLSYDLFEYRVHIQEFILETALSAIIEKSQPAAIFYTQPKVNEYSVRTGINFAFGSILKKYKVSEPIKIAAGGGQQAPNFFLRTISFYSNKILHSITEKTKLKDIGYIILCHSRFYWYSRKYILHNEKRAKISSVIINDEVPTALLKQYPLSYITGDVRSFGNIKNIKRETSEQEMYIFPTNDSLQEISGEYFNQLFQRIVRSRICMIEELKEKLISLIKNHTSATVITTNLPDAFSSVVRISCRLLRRRLEVYPHGLLGYLSRSEYQYGEYIVGHQFARKTLIEQGVPEHRIKLDRRVMVEDEYKTSSKLPKRLRAASSGINILVIFDPVSGGAGRFATCLASPFGYSAQIKGMRACMSLLKNDKISVYFKAHPGSFESDLYDFTDLKMKRLVIQKNSSLSKCAAHAEFVICLNYLGVGLINLTKMGVPIVHFVTSERVGYHKNGDHTFDAGELLKSGITVRTEERLHNVVSKIIINSSFRNNLRDRSQKFYNSFFT